MQTSIRALAFCLAVLGCVTPAHADSVNDLLLPGEVIQGHVKYESDCSNCHKDFDKSAQSGLCKDCHKEIAKDVAEKRGYHGLMKDEKECKECHTEHQGRNARIAVLNTINFDHLVTGFELKGGHLNDKVLCKDCHSPLKKYRRGTYQMRRLPRERSTNTKVDSGTECDEMPRGEGLEDYPFRP